MKLQRVTKVVLRQREIYEEEMKNFLDAVKRKKKYPHSFSDELKVLQVLDAIEQSSKKEKKIVLHYNKL